MSKTIEFQVPCKDGTTRTETGKVAIFQIANQKIKFVIQKCGSRGVQLTHYASGQTAANADAVLSVKLHLWRSSPNGRTPNREACRQALEAAEKRIGAAKMLTIMASAKVINK